MKKFIQKNYKIIVFIILTIFYFEYSVSITWDSAHYLGYVKIFERLLPFSTWDVVRGPVFPLIIYIGNILFSKTSHGLLINTYIYYLIMLFFTAKILDYYFNKFTIKEKTKNIIKNCIILLIIVNPIIYGYYHCLLTEFVAITLSVFSCYYAIIWLNTDYYKDKKAYIHLSILFIFLTIFSWFLKQPYVSCGFFALAITYIISIFQFKNKKQFLVRTITILSCILCLFISIKVWNAILNSNGNDTSTNRNPTNGLGNQLINAIDYLEIDKNEEIFSRKFIKKSKLSKQEKEDIYKLLNNNEKYILIYKFNKSDKLVDVDYIKSSNGYSVSVFSSINYLLKSFIGQPIRFLDSYIINYFSIIDIYKTETEDGVRYNSTKKFDINFSNEITAIGNFPYRNNSNMFQLSEELYNNAHSYEQPNNANRILNKIMALTSNIFVVLFKLVFLLLPILFIYSIILRLLKKYKKYHDKLNLIIILFGFSVLHLLLHTVTGAIIDRYAMPAYITTSLGIVMLIMIKCKNKAK